MRSRALTALIIGVSLTAPAAEAGATPASIGRPVVQCQAKIAGAAGKFVTRRRKTLERCLEEAVACPGTLAGAASAADDACLAAVAGRCRAKLAGLEGPRQRLDASGPACTGGAGAPPLVTMEDFFGEDGLAYEFIAPLCPDLTMREGVPADYSVCQRSALRCSADRAVGLEVPRAAELLGRLEIPLEDAGVCLGAGLCGNGQLDGDEECDDGPANSNTVPDACRMHCTDAACGDGVVDSDEHCDDGNLSDGDGCAADCLVEDGVCGNGVLEGDEECDDGNLADGDGCDADCLLESVCGNGIVEDDEDCDDGNLADGDGCAADCLLEGVCGNGEVEGDEECDDGPANSDVLPDHCRTDCTDPVCGDGVVDPDELEECEPPGSLLCTPDCEWRFSLPVRGGAAAGARPPAGMDDLGTCQHAIIRGGTRVADRTRRLVQRCVMQLARCMIGIPEDRDPAGTRFDACLAEAQRRCEATVAARDSLVARTVIAVADQCRTDDAAIPLERLVDPTTGLGFAPIAAACPFPAEGTPAVGDLLACVLGHERCVGERAVGETIPRANEFLWELDLDPEESFPCVLDPADFDF
jgi:cysteine-rich repeat protein